ncbi:hypothetical protein T07_8210 [Trichinella nelsoni]|uniref:PiggyBac transposable element-derived protein domain-containing protein n=1 Tax=Trichinella nelsoni TaxID=6336 RepID=A0A0V0RTG3_9BILA|nr:hypothetical protein T07_8210 [Trichinella nelsoni]
MPEIIDHYNKSKYGVSIAEQMIRVYTCSRITRRWPLWLFMNILDTVVLNAYIIWTFTYPN